MEQFNLSDYSNLSTDKILKIKLKKDNKFIYGTIIRTGMLTKPTDKPLNKGIWKDFNKINDFDNYREDKLTYNDFTLLKITGSEIEDIEIITV